MGTILTISAGLTLVALLLSAGVALRMTASLVQTYAPGKGSPHLATGVRIVGLLLIGEAVGLAGMTGLMSLTIDALQRPNILLGTAALIVAGFLLVTGITVFFWGRALRLPVRSSTLEWGTRIAVCLAWSTGFLSMATCLAMYFEPVMAFAVLPLLLMTLTILFLIELVAGWGRRSHRQLWELWQICLAIRSRRPLGRELDLLREYSWGAQRRRLAVISEELYEGAAAEDILIQPAFLSAMEGAQVTTGMRAGRLPETLQALLARRTALSNDLLATQDRFYAALRLCLTLLILAGVAQFILHYIIPKFLMIFKNFDIDLPPLTQYVFTGSNATTQISLLVVPFIGLVAAGTTLVAALPFAASFPHVRERLSRIWPRICLPEMLQSLSVAIAGRIPLEEALVPFIRRQFAIPLHSRLVRVQEAVREGSDCWNELAVERLLTPTEATLLQSAQRAGNLPWALEAIGLRCEQRWRFRLMVCLEFIQPSVLVCIATLVAFFVVALFLPLTKLIHEMA